MFKGSTTFYRPNAKGTGSAARFSLEPATEFFVGKVHVQLARQVPPAGAKFPAFDFDSSVSVMLDREDLAQVIMVLRGCQESINDGKGLFHRTTHFSTLLKFEHRIEPLPGYFLTVTRKLCDGESSVAVTHFFSMSEALALMLALEHSMPYIFFGVPADIA